VGVIIAIIILRQKGYIGGSKQNAYHIEDPHAPSSGKPSTLPLSGNQPRGTITVVQANIDPSKIPPPDHTLTKFEIDYREIEDLTALGKGSFGVVFRFVFYCFFLMFFSQWKMAGNRCCCKTITRKSY
jgi:hypothetical protein